MLRIFCVFAWLDWEGHPAHSTSINVWTFPMKILPYYVVSMTHCQASLIFPLNSVYRPV